MPTRRIAKGPGEFIRDHLRDSGGRDYVGSIYQAYKAHLRRAGVRKLPCRPTFHTCIWMLIETGAIVFDGAEALSFSAAQPETLPVDYAPACGMPAPRHYHRVADLQHPAFISPKGVWMEQRGQAPPLDRPPATEQELRRLIDQLADPEAFTQWLEWAMDYTDPAEMECDGLKP